MSFFVPMAQAQSCPNGGSALNSQWIVIDRSGDGSNNEQEFYCPSQVTLTANGLQISAIHRTTGGQPYTSGAVVSKFSFVQGVLEYSAKMMGGTGSWPAIWILGTQCQPSTPSAEPNCNWPNPGSDELDVTEILNSNLSQVNQQIHSSAGCGSGADCGCKPSTANVSTNYHKYALANDGGTIRWFIDGALTCSAPANQLSATPHYIIINGAVGGTGTVMPNASTFPQTMTVQYVRHYASAAYPLPAGATPDFTDGFGSTPGAPAEPTSPQVAVTSHSATLSWSETDTGDTFNVLRGAAANGPFSTIVDSLSTKTYEDDTVAAGQIYFYEVTATNSAGTSAPSAAVQAVIPGGTTPPPSPALTISTAFLASGTVGATYTSQVTAIGGTTPYAWRASGLAPGLSISASSGAITGKPTTAGTFSETITATDKSAPMMTAQATYSVTIAAAAPPPPPSCKAVYMRAGGPSFKDASGNTWQGNLGVSGGTSYATSFAIKGATVQYPAALFQDEQWGSFKVTLPAAPGCKYAVTMLEAESTFTRTGQRIFSVQLNGAAWLTNLDLIAASGGIHTAVTRSTTVTATGSSVVLNFVKGSADQPKVDAISLVPTP